LQAQVFVEEDISALFSAPHLELKLMSLFLRGWWILTPVAIEGSGGDLLTRGDDGYRKSAREIISLRASNRFGMEIVVWRVTE